MLYVACMYHPRPFFYSSFVGYLHFILALFIHLHCNNHTTINFYHYHSYHHRHHHFHFVLFNSTSHWERIQFSQCIWVAWHVVFLIAFFVNYSLMITVDVLTSLSIFIL